MPRLTPQELLEELEAFAESSPAELEKEPGQERESRTQQIKWYCHWKNLQMLSLVYFFLNLSNNLQYALHLVWGSFDCAAASRWHLDSDPGLQHDDPLRHQREN
ncbi:hypothetical protein DTO271D3_7517 [Paecilomyces variotii]|nr:hypothetical protein DTO169C6_7279 [Paecilomyces variotii]KAJ9231398.1 hypothetical protein DTO169E5_8010 [Paecilomyces variotii]KAJ9312216.1 hypothetical protein DTO271D3_7517 [Paecilomyces variotii]